MPSRDLSATRIWLTGASSGIGAALAKAALDRGAQVAASGRRLRPLQDLRPPDAPHRLLPLVFDARDAAATAAAADTIRAEWGGADWIIANAGDCAYIDPPPRWDADTLRAMMEINFFGVANTAAAGLPLLSDARGRGLFATVSSAATLAPLPRGGAYGASKCAAAYFVESLRGHYPQVDFSVITPGFVQTPLTDKNDFAMPMRMPAARAAQIILRGLQRRRGNIRFPRRLMAILHIINCLPPRLQQKLLATMLPAAPARYRRGAN